jgi:hypothetical protein
MNVEKIFNDACDAADQHGYGVALGPIKVATPYASGGGYSISYEPWLEYGAPFGNGFGISGDILPDGVEPKPGDLVMVWTRGLSYIAGIQLNENLLSFKTPTELDRQHKEEQEKLAAERKQKFEETGRQRQDERLARLPEIFRNRVLRFREKNPEWRWTPMGEDYEAAIYEAAAAVAEACNMDTDSIRRLKDEPFDAIQKRIAPALPDSGYSFDATFAYAIAYASGELERAEAEAVDD